MFFGKLLYMMTVSCSSALTLWLSDNAFGFLIWDCIYPAKQLNLHMPKKEYYGLYILNINPTSSVGLCLMKKHISKLYTCISTKYVRSQWKVLYLFLEYGYLGQASGNKHTPIFREIALYSIVCLHMVFKTSSLKVK